ncbi:hypothetical protein KIH74_15275 [Kineosporia sp. J2-2]|uniref:Uncharacterized protein n=1 Tax=Kineosporia corallincola TaxID=2835133 RepID=A0ABS5TGT2_9ACTN|nr:hypothetical protein [Kineosporia corallincola]MBT0770302.1 hypothetical protein [Kineosporia corallincola]
MTSVLGRLDTQGRADLTRQVSVLSGEVVRAWMVEAVLRCIEGDAAALVGIDPGLVSRIHLNGLRVLTDGYLTDRESWPNGLIPAALLVLPAFGHRISGDCWHSGPVNTRNRQAL